MDEVDAFAVENFNSTIMDHTTALSPMHMQSFDDVQSPEVGSISMCTSPPPERRREKEEAPSPARCLIVLSPTILRSTPSPRMAHQFSCVRQMSFGEESHFSRTSPLHFNSTPQVHSPLPKVWRTAAPQTVVPRRPVDRPPAGAEDSWQGDSSGVAKDMSTLYVNKHHYDYDCNSEENITKHKFRKGLAGGHIASGLREGESQAIFEGEVHSRNGPSPIMTDHTSFMDLLDAASESPIDKSYQNDQNDKHTDGIKMSSFSSTSRTRPVAFNMGSQTRNSSSPFRQTRASSCRTPQRSTHTLQETGSRSLPPKMPLVADLVRPESSLDKVPAVLFDRALPVPRSDVDSFYSSPGTSRTGKRVELSPPDSFTSVTSCNTSCTEDDEAHSPVQKYGSSRSILSDFGSVHDTLLKRNGSSSSMMKRTGSNNSILSNNSSLPLPDQSAFDSSVIKPRKSGGGRGAPSPVCPPTPDRGNAHWGSAYANNSIGSIDLGGSGVHDSRSDDDDTFGMHIAHQSLSQAYPLLRQNSLDSNKILCDGDVSRDPSNTADVVYDRDFENLGVLGAGSFAIVYFSRRRRQPGTASDDSSDRVFAVKKSKKKFRGRGDRNSLMNEVQMMKLAGTTTCPHIVHLIRAWQEDSFLYVQMDVAEKGSLRDLIMNMTDNNMAFPELTIWRLVHDTLQGLKHIHSYDVVHLDIKPANLLLSRNGRVMIGDFGLAAHAHDDKDGNEGDARYMAPEMLNFSARSSASDMFSFGLTIYEICLVPTSGAILPVQGDLWTDLREGRIPPVQTEFENRSQAMNELLLACMTPVPQQRATAVQLLMLPEVSHVAELNKAENEISPDAILTAIPVAQAIPIKMARSASFLFSHRPIDPIIIPPIDMTLCDQANRQQMTTPNADLTTPIHADNLQYNSATMFRFKK